MPIGAAGSTSGPHTDYDLSGWLGGTKTSDAEVEVEFLSKGGRVIGSGSAGPVGGTGRRGATSLAYRHISGVVPAGSATAEVTLMLQTSLTNYDGPDAPQIGYNRAVADDIRFSLSTVVASLRSSALP